MGKRSKGRADTEGRARRILAGLRRIHPDADCELVHSDPFELLVSTILSAQTTDKAVNQVTPALFRRYPTPRALAAARPEDVEPLIARIGLYRNKAKAIVGAARAIEERFEGRVPKTREQLESLPGVGRKTANVVLPNAFGVPGLAVDTHVSRLARRLGLSRHDDPRKIENDLTELFDESDWQFVSHALIWHGRRVCDARRPLCNECGIAPDCPSAGTLARGDGRARRARRAVPAASRKTARSRP